ncbi:cache domain-containing protein [Undibacterium pigrum]|uniref:Single cache domain-containing protein n=1 Tax=Undibacterium pigrum TaxID=401470 RepID=A0A318IUQ6_9BURK|nr:cache domain-containing protein [Undibacterium pigrum]PXX38753.1 single cache domain-containing protein [Undibacterium pigrum]
MRSFIKFLALMFFSVFVSHSVLAADHGTTQEAEAMVKKAIPYIKTKGNEAAYSEFNNATGSFIDRDMYIFVLDLNGKVLAHGANAKLIGKNLSTLKDVDEKPFIEELLAIAKSKGKGWIDYKWPNPTTKVIELKSTYFEKNGDVIVACGIYK